MSETTALPPKSGSQRFVALLTTALVAAGTAFAAAGIYLAWRVYHQMETLLSLNVFGMGGADPAAVVQVLGRLAFGTLLVSSLTLVLTLVLGFGYAYLRLWAGRERS